MRDGVLISHEEVTCTKILKFSKALLVINQTAERLSLPKIIDEEKTAKNLMAAIYDVMIAAVGEEISGVRKDLDECIEKIESIINGVEG